jgi:hypothetical protein
MVPSKFINFPFISPDKGIKGLNLIVLLTGKLATNPFGSTLSRKSREISADSLFQMKIAVDSCSKGFLIFLRTQKV